MLEGLWEQIKSLEREKDWRHKGEGSGSQTMVSEKTRWGDIQSTRWYDSFSLGWKTWEKENREVCGFGDRCLSLLGSGYDYWLYMIRLWTHWGGLEREVQVHMEFQLMPIALLKEEKVWGILRYIPGDTLNSFLESITDVSLKAIKLISHTYTHTSFQSWNENNMHRFVFIMAC